MTNGVEVEFKVSWGVGDDNGSEVEPRGCAFLVCGDGEFEPKLKAGNVAVYAKAVRELYKSGVGGPGLFGVLVEGVPAVSCDREEGAVLELGGSLWIGASECGPDVETAVAGDEVKGAEVAGDGASERAWGEDCHFWGMNAFQGRRSLLLVDYVGFWEPGIVIEMLGFGSGGCGGASDAFLGLAV